MAEGQHSLRYIERDAVMHRIYPLVKLAWVFMVAAGLFLYKTPISGAINFVVLLLLTYPSWEIYPCARSWQLLVHPWVSG